MDEEVKKTTIYPPSGCQINGEWQEFRNDFNHVARKIYDTHDLMENLLAHTEHLKKLDLISVSMNDIKNGLMAAATSKDQISTKVAMQVAKILGWVIMGLVVILVAILTGQHFSWINQVK